MMNLKKRAACLALAGCLAIGAVPAAFAADTESAELTTIEAMQEQKANYYASDGYLTSAFKYTTSNGTIYNYTYTYEYDAVGNVTKETETLDGTVVSVTTYAYNSNGDLAYEKSVLGDPGEDGYGDTYNEITYAYDGRTLSTENDTQYTDGEYETGFVYEYYTNGNLMGAMQVDEAGDVVTQDGTAVFDFTYSYEYDDNGNVKTETATNATTGKTSYTTVYEYDSDGDIKTATTTYADGDVDVETYTYDDANNTYTVVMSENGTITDTTVYTIGTAGVTKIVDTSADGAVDTAEFSYIQKPAVTLQFTDIQDADVWYFLPIYWAYQAGITKGMTDTTFVPSDDCTREQVATFLWRAAGEPEPTSTTSSFTDVTDSSRYSYKAILWATEQGIIKGVGDNKFAPTDTCTRAQFVTMLYRSKGEPEPTTTSSFSDVTDSSAYYYNAVLWAVENGITTGMTESTFVPGGTCTRGQVVTFLYRAYN